MPSFKRPGVYAEEVLNLSQTVSAPGGSLAAFVGPHTRGPVTPVYIESWSEFLQYFGGFGLANQYLPHAVYQFFSNGGRAAWVARVAGPATGTSTRTLKDSVNANDTLKIDAINPGTWGQQIYVETQNNGTDRFNLIVRYGGTGDQYIVERWTELSMSDNDPRYVEKLINAPVTGSLYIKVTDMDADLAGTPTAAPADRPVVTAAAALTGPASDPAVTNTELTAAVSATSSILDSVEGPLTINMPGVFDTAVLSGLVAYCAARGDCFAVLDPAENQTVTQVITTAGGLASSYGALYYPWLYVADPSSNVQGAIRKLPPGGAVVGQYVRTDSVRGVWKAPAGIDTRIAGAIGIETKLTNANLDDLNQSLVNAIRHIPGTGIVIMGARTLRAAQSDRYIPVRRTLNYIRKALIDGTRWAVFEPNDATLWGGLSTNIQAFLLTLWQRGGLRGRSSAEAFYVKCDDSNNTPQSISAGQVNIEVGVAVQYPAEFVVIKIGQWEGGATATVTV